MTHLRLSHCSGSSEAALSELSVVGSDVFIIHVLSRTNIAFLFPV